MAAAGQPEAEETPPAGKPASAARFLDYLSELTDHLSRQKKADFFLSSNGLRMEYLRSRLKGKQGVLGEREGVPPARVTKRGLRDTLQYLQALATQHPVGGIGESQSERVRALLNKLR